MTDGALARFDDLVAGRAMVFPDGTQTLVADRPEDVPAVLEEVDRATAAGCWAYGLVSYEAAPGLDSTLMAHLPEPGGVPPAWFTLTTAPQVVGTLAEPEPLSRALWSPDWSDAEHEAAVAAVRARIAAGDTYQCNLTDRLRTRDTLDPRQLYARLAHGQGGRYNALLVVGEHTVVSASPELFFDWTYDGRLRTRPMKGTAARERTAAEDRLAAERLRSTPKERAENLMIVDLLRNDLSRVAETGSVRVAELLALEAYPTVWQMTSEVAARTRSEVGLVDVFRALFPCGSVTGAPKARTMQLIRRLEPSPRGVYCGAIGFVAPRDHTVRARFSVAIRTAVVDRRLGTAVYGSGGGVTWDSQAAAERAELMTKARLLVGGAAANRRRYGSQAAASAPG